LSAYLPLWITCIVVLPVLALIFYVVQTSRPGRFRLTATLLKLVSINIEVDAQDKPGELSASPGERPERSAGLQPSRVNRDASFWLAVPWRRLAQAVVLVRPGPKG
jgi:hypothetical protein